MDCNRSQNTRGNNAGLRAAVAAGLLVATLASQSVFAAKPVFVDAPVVEFESAPFTCAPSPFKVKQAIKLDKPVPVLTQPSVSITGYLARPEGNAPSAAIREFLAKHL